MNLEALAEERRRIIRDADDLICCLPIKFEIEFSPRPTVIPVGEMVELAASQWSLRKRRSSDRDAHSRRLARDAPLLCDWFGVRDDTARNEALAALLLTREHKNRVTFGNQLAAIHRLVRGERERPRPRIDNLRFDREHHDGPRSRHDPSSYTSNSPRLAPRQLVPVRSRRTLNRLYCGGLARGTLWGIFFSPIWAPSRGANKSTRLHLLSAVKSSFYLTA